MERLLACVAAAALLVLAADYRPPAGNRPAVARPAAASILPGGRAIVPFGKHFRTGPGPFGLALNAKGSTVVTADGGPDRYSLTVVSQAKDGWHSEHLVAPKGKEEEDDDDERDWRSVFMGLADRKSTRLNSSHG